MLGGLSEHPTTHFASSPGPTRLGLFRFLYELLDCNRPVPVRLDIFLHQTNLHGPGLTELTFQQMTQGLGMNVIDRNSMVQQFTEWEGW